MKVVKLVLIKGLVLPFMAYLLQCVQSSDLTEDFASEFTTTTIPDEANTMFLEEAQEENTTLPPPSLNSNIGD